MQMWLNFILVVALAAMVGVSISVNQIALERVRRDAYIEAHPELSEEVTFALAKGKLVEGMDTDQVRVSWGKPASVKVMANQPNIEMWAYENSLVLFDHDEVKHWAKTQSKYDSGEDLVRRYEYTLTNEINDRTTTMIQKGQIGMGMTPEEVTASWGDPVEVLPIYSDTLGEFTVWVYERGRKGRTTITFQEGEVLSWAELPEKKA